MLYIIRVVKKNSAEYPSVDLAGCLGIWLCYREPKCHRFYIKYQVMNGWETT